MHEEEKWNRWNPGLDNDEKTLKEVMESLPANDPEEISLIVRLLENPASPIALTGAVTLERHDCIHAVLGRGLLPQDEAFVVGFTMGTAHEILSELEQFIFKKVARYLYPTNYRLSKKHLKAYELGVEAGKKSRVQMIYEFPFEDYYDWRMVDLRRLLHVDTKTLRDIYKKEQQLLPATKASHRLPV